MNDFLCGLIKTRYLPEVSMGGNFVDDEVDEDHEKDGCRHHDVNGVR